MTTLERRPVLYCGECGMPPEYCEYGPDYETHCKSWLLKSYPNVYAELKALRKGGDNDANECIVISADAADGAALAKPTPQPWTTEERLTQFYKKYQPDKLDGVATILEKYAGKEDKLFIALVRKYGAEPEDPYNLDSDDDDQDDDGGGGGGNVERDIGGLSLAEKKKKRRGAAAKKSTLVDTRIVIQKVSRNKRKAVTIVVGMDTVPDIKLKEVAKAFSKRFAGSSSVKDTPAGKKDIIIQGDHMDEVAKMIVDKFKVPADAVFLDIDGEFVPITPAR